MINRAAGEVFPGLRPTARCGVRLTPARNAAVALPGSLIGRTGRCLPLAFRYPHEVGHLVHPWSGNVEHQARPAVMSHCPDSSGQ